MGCQEEAWKYRFAEPTWRRAVHDFRFSTAPPPPPNGFCPRDDGWWVIAEPQAKRAEDQKGLLAGIRIRHLVLISTRPNGTPNPLCEMYIHLDLSHIPLDGGWFVCQQTGKLILDRAYLLIFSSAGGGGLYTEWGIRQLGGGSLAV
jgi:hypothetical protein